MSAIKVENASKHYSIKKKLFKKPNVVNAMNNISLEVDEGEIVALLGLNGSGKSTLLKCLTGIICPTTGKISVNGLDPHKDRKKSILNMGVVFGQKSSFIEDLSVEDNLMVYKSLYNISDYKYEEVISYLEKFLSFKSLMEKSFRRLSFGQRIKCEIVSILLHEPKLIFLDEPTIGLDIIVKEELFNMLKEYNKKNKATIIITTHELEALDGFCTRIILMDKGNKIIDDSPNNIKKKIKLNKKISVKYTCIKDTHMFNNFVNKFNVSIINKSHIEFELNADEIESEIYQNIFNCLEILSIETSVVGLEEAIRKLYD